MISNFFRSITLRHVIVATVIIPVVLLFTLWILYRFYTPESFTDAPYTFEERDFAITGVDAARLPGTIVEARTVVGSQTVVDSQSNDMRPVAILVADLQLDRNWNSKSLSFRSGARLARILAAYGGVTSYRFDNRGTGDHGGSVLTYNDINLKMADFVSVLRAARETYPQRPVLILAHGTACAPVLKALQADRTESISIRAIYLLACGSVGNELENRGEQIFHNMELRGVSRENIRQARQEWKHWQAAGAVADAVPEDAPETHPDIIAFRNGMRYYSAPEQSDYIQTMRNLNLTDLLRSHLRQGIPITHFLGGKDMDLPTEVFHQTVASGTELTAAYPGYKLHVIENMNHFLKEQHGVREGLPDLIMERMNPFRVIAPEFLRLLLESVGSD